MADNSGQSMSMFQTATTYTASGDAPQAGSILRATGPGGLNFSASDAAGEFRFLVAGVQIGSIDDDGLDARLSAGSVGTPTLRLAADLDTGIYSTGVSNLSIALSGRQAISIDESPAPTLVHLTSGALGNSARGPEVKIGRNTSNNAAPGHLNLVDKNGTEWFIWVDTTGDVRIGNAPPQADNSVTDTAGTVVGTQT